MYFLKTVALAALLTVPLQDVGFTGLWERDEERSDDPQAKMQAAMEQMREQMGQRGGGGRPPGGGGFGGGFGGGHRRGGREGGGRGRPELGNIADELRVEMSDAEFHVDDGERLSIYYLDGEKHKREMPNGSKLETTSELKGNAVVIQEEMDRGQLDRKYELSPDGATMIVTLTVKMRRMKDPVVIRTVYMRAEGAGES